MLSASNTQARQPVKFAVSALTMAIMLATFVMSPAQADDLEIYQPAATASGSTLVLMLDAAGSMNSGNPSNLDQVVLGLQIFLATDDTTVNKTALGLGHFNNFNDPGGSGTTGNIVVPARTMGAVSNSTTTFGTFGQYVAGKQLYAPAITTPRSQRRILWDFVVAKKNSETTAPNEVGYAFNGNGPDAPASGFAEAAAYLLGTTTTGAPDSGFSTSVNASKNGAIYQTPLTSTSGRCAGVGIYFLTSAAFQNKNTTDIGAIFSKALSTPTSTATFTCPALATAPFNDQGSAPWSCLGKFAQTLHSGTSPAALANPSSGVQIKTAFVGFGSNFASLSDNDAKDVCHIGSKLKGDSCSPDSTTNANPAGGYGNGGFYAVTSPLTVTSSVKNFILTLGGNTVTPLVTGAPSIPIDDLNPNGFQNYGYLRMIAPNPGEPSKMLWNGNLKKYALSGGAMVSNGEVKDTGECTVAAPFPCILNNLGQLVIGTTTDDWNAANGGSGDGGNIVQGGAYPVVPMPTSTNPNKIRPLFTDIGGVTTVTASTAGTSPSPTATSIMKDKTVAFSGVANGALLTPVKPLTSAGVLATDLHTTIPQMFDATNTSINNGSPLKDLTIVQKKKLINYLGFNTRIYGPDGNPVVAQRAPAEVAYTTTDTTVTPNITTTYYFNDPVGVPADLTLSPQPALTATPYLAMGGSVHAQPIQFSYLSDISASGVITNRKESVLYGTMEGALHLVNATSGVEQMAFIPAEILADDIASRALRVDEVNASSTGPADLLAPAQGVDGPWVADPAHKTLKKDLTATPPRTSDQLTATRMNVYGGLRLGGSSYYGLDLLDVNNTTNVAKPKLLFRVGPDIAGFERMGKSFSKPVLANVRYNGVVTRVMIVGGGYDNSSGSDSKGYENTAYVPTTTDPAKGNAVYMVNAKTGALIWQANGASQTLPTYTSPVPNPVQTTNSNMIHSVPARVSAIDRDGDQLIDSVYFADIGGQLFRADFNNKYGTSTDKFAARVTRLANLATDTTGAAITNGTNPRFFEAPTVTIHDEGSSTFGLVTLAGGNRSAPLDVLDAADGGRDLRSQPVNNVYGIVDRDIARPDLVKLVGSTYMNANGVTPYTSSTANLTLKSLQKDPQVALSGIIGNAFFTPSTSSNCNQTSPASSQVCDGWYRSLSSRNNSDGTVSELSGGAFTYALTAKPMYSGGMKAFEEQIALTGKLYVPVYDPQGTGVSGGVCQARVVGETDLQTYCLPYGVCTTNGSKNATEELTSGAKFVSSGSLITNDKVIGPGIRGIALGADNRSTARAGACTAFSLVGNQGAGGSGESWNCTKKLVPTLWYEKQPNRSKVQ